MIRRSLIASTLLLVNCVAAHADAACSSVLRDGIRVDDRTTIVFKNDPKTGLYGLTVRVSRPFWFPDNYPITDDSKGEGIDLSPQGLNSNCDSTYSQLRSIRLVNGALIAVPSRPKSHDPFVIHYDVQRRARTNISFPLDRPAWITSLAYADDRVATVSLAYDAPDGKVGHAASTGWADLSRLPVVLSMDLKSVGGLAADSKWAIFENSDRILQSYSFETGKFHELRHRDEYQNNNNAIVDFDLNSAAEKVVFTVAEGDRIDVLTSDLDGTERKTLFKNGLQDDHCEYLDESSSSLARFACIWENAQEIYPFLSCDDSRLAVQVQTADGIGISTIDLVSGETTVVEKPARKPGAYGRLTRACGSGAY